MRGPKKRLTPFGKMVVKALADRDMSRAELAATVGTSPQYMSYILNGTRSTDRSVNAYNAYRKDSIIKLTRKGVDLVEGTINDPGIDV